MHCAATPFYDHGLLILLWGRFNIHGCRIMWCVSATRRWCWPPPRRRLLRLFFIIMFVVEFLDLLPPLLPPLFPLWQEIFQVNRRRRLLPDYLYLPLTAAAAANMVARSFLLLLLLALPTPSMRHRHEDRQQQEKLPKRPTWSSWWQCIGSGILWDDRWIYCLRIGV